MIDFVFTTDNVNETVTITGYRGKDGPVVVPDTIGNWPVTAIGDRAFWECTGLIRVILPDGLATIGDSAFASCKGLISIVLPNSITSIGDYAFYGCTGLTSIVLPKGPTTYGDFVFHGCPAYA